ncbi:hypothetical protein [Haloglomus salinum]|uniref:hypothetical protein n=1 Tax=Haloglomus salinum TaxID=2962673 RepID=UPI0020CA1CAA|nr:hypothetical protein [Haloglomus salinum]
MRVLTTNTLAAIFAGLLVVGMVGAVAGPSSTETSVDYQFSAQDTNTANFDLAADGNGTAIVTGTGQKLGPQQTLSEVQGDRDVTFDKIQRDSQVTFIGQETQEQGAQDFIQDYSSVPSYDSKNVTVENGELVLDTYQETTTTTTVLDDFSDGDIAEYSGDTGSFSVSNGQLEVTTDSDAVIHRNDVTVEQGDVVHLDMGRTSTEATFSAFSFGGSDYLSSYNVVESSNEWQLKGPQGGTLDSGGNGAVDGLNDVTIDVSGQDIVVDVPGGTLTAPGDASNVNGGIGWRGYKDTLGSATWTVGDNVEKETQTTVTKTNSTGRAVTEYTSTETWQEARLNWTETETGGTVQHYVALGSPSGYTEWQDADENTFKDITDGQDVYVKTILNHSSGSGPSVDQVQARVKYNQTLTTTDPSLTVDGTTVSYTGTLNDSETVVREIGTVSDGAQTFDVSTSSGVVNHTYTGHQEGRVHVTKVHLDDSNTTTDTFLAQGQTLTIDDADTLKGIYQLEVSTADDTTNTTVASVALDGSYTAYEGIYTNTRLTLSTQSNTVFDYGSSVSAENRLQNLSVAAVNAGTTAEIAAYDHSAVNNSGVEVLDIRPDDNVTVTVSDLSADHRYVVSRGGNLSDPIEPTDGSITFESGASVTEFYTYDTDGTYKQQGSFLATGGTGNDSILSAFTNITGLPGILLIIGAVVGVLVLGIMVVTRR